MRQRTNFPVRGLCFLGKLPPARVALILLVCVVLAACSIATKQTPTPLPLDDKLAQVLQSGTLVIATDPAYPPQSELLDGVPQAEQTRCSPTEYTSNQMKGFDIDVAREIARRLGVEPCFVVPKWTQIVSGNWGDHWDISVGSMAVTRERMAALYFTQPYDAGQAVLFVYKDNQTYQEPSDLSGKRIGVCTGCAYEFYLKGTLDIPGEKINFAIRNATIVGYDTDTDALNDLAAGDGVHLDGAITDPDTGKAVIQNGLPIKQLGGPLYYDYVAAAIDKNSSKDPISFVRKVSQIIQQMHQDGTLLKFSMQYYGGDFTTPASQINYLDYGQLPK